MSNEPYIDVVVTRRFDATPEQVFDAFLDMGKASKFFFATPEGEMVRCEIDPKVGGRFVMTDRRADGDVEHIGFYRELDRPHKIVFEYGIPAYSADMDRVTIEITAIVGGSEITLTHALNPEWKDYAERTQKGWSMILENLAKVA